MSWNTASFMGWLYWVYWIVAIFIMVRVMLKNRDTVKTLAWIMVFVFLPFLVGESKRKFVVIVLDNSTVF
jgi:hypothetical protein